MEQAERAGGARERAREKADACWEARLAGLTWQQAAKHAGYTSRQHAYRAVLDQRGELPVPEREHLRDVWRQRIELVWRQALRDVLERKPSAVTHSMRCALAAMQLDGLAMPTRVSVDVEAGLDALLASLTTPVIEGKVLDDGR